VNLPDRVIVFDAACLLCNGRVQWLCRRDRARRYRFCAMQSVTGAQLMRGHGLDPADPTSFLFLDHGRAYYGADGVIEVLAGLGRLWRAAALLRLVPEFLREACYRLVARNRYRWWGRSAICLAVDSEMQERFVE
jgi:predicted DCC family thiol-disulfide oxidoreductase YuxK